MYGMAHSSATAAADPKQAAPVSDPLQPGQQVETTLESEIHLVLASDPSCS